MKKLLAIPAICITIFSTLFFASCSDDDPVNSSRTYYLVNSLSGTINNMSPTNRLLKAITLIDTTRHIIGTQYIPADNTFNISLPVPDAAALMDVDLLFFNMATNNTTVSDHDARVNYVVMHMFDSSNVYRGYIIKDNRTSGNIYFEGFTKIFYLYSDRNVTITGTSKRITGSDTTEFSYNQDLGVGWNVLSQKITKIRTNYTGIDFTSGELPGTSWYYGDL